MLQTNPKVKEIPQAVEDAVILLAWAGEVPGHSKAAEPIKVFLKEGTRPVKQNHYLLKLEAGKRLEKIIEKFLRYH